MMGLPKLYRYWAMFRPEAEAVVCEDVRLTWRALAAGAEAVCAELQRRGVTPGDRVGLLLANCAEWAVAYVGLTFAGAVLVPLNPRFGSFELRGIEGDAECAAIITTRALGAPLVDRFALGEGADDAILIASRGGAGPAAADFAAVVAGGGRGVPVDPAPDDLSAIFYTSGSTGLPKGTMQTNASIIAYVTGYSLGLGFTSEDRALIVAPLAFTGGSLSLLIPMLAIGACAVIERGLDPARVLRLVEAERISFMTMVPAIWERLPRLDGWAAADLSSLRVAMTGGAPVPVSLLERYRAKGVGIRQAYGCTEVGAMGCTPPLDVAMRRPEAVGYPQATLEARVVKDGRDCAPGETGELWMRGPQVMRGYWRNPEMTAAAFDGDWLKTGDLVRRDADGIVTVVDRLRNMVISGGVNIYPAEIERALSSLDCVVECGVFGAPDPRWGERVVALVHCREAVDLPDLQAQARALLGPLKTPREIVLCPAPLPKTVTNKVARTELAALHTRLTTAG